MANQTFFLKKVIILNSNLDVELIFYIPKMLIKKDVRSKFTYIEFTFFRL